MLSVSEKLLSDSSKASCNPVVANDLDTVNLLVGAVVSITNEPINQEF